LWELAIILGKKNPKLDTTFIANFAANIGTPAMVFYCSNNNRNYLLNIFARIFLVLLY
jgi:hypothetical protein